MEKMIEPFIELVFDEPTIDFSKDMIQFGIDSLIDGPLKGLPFASFIINSGKFFYNVHDRNLLNQTFKFIQEFNKGTIEPEKLEKYKNSIKENSQKAEKELGRLLIILDRTIDFEKTTNLAKLYKAYVNEIINWNSFIELSEVNERLFINDISVISEIYANGMKVDKERIHNFLRLVSLGLLKNDSRFDSDNCGDSLIASEPVDAVELTILGEQFCNLIQ